LLSLSITATLCDNETVFQPNASLKNDINYEREIIYDPRSLKNWLIYLGVMLSLMMGFFFFIYALNYYSYRYSNLDLAYTDYAKPRYTIERAKREKERLKPGGSRDP
jgi:hypothetical protein